MKPIPEITVQELKALVDTDQPPFILDVREEKEYEVANIGGYLVPLREIPTRMDELLPYKDKFTVVLCRSGGRSAQALRFLQFAGFTNINNLRGGMLAWSKEIDPTVPTY